MDPRNKTEIHPIGLRKFHEKTNQNQAREGHDIPDIIVTEKGLINCLETF